MTTTKLNQPVLDPLKDAIAEPNPLNNASIISSGFRADILTDNIWNITDGTLKVMQAVVENEKKQQQLGDLSNANITVAGLNPGQYQAQSIGSGLEVGEKRFTEQAELMAREAAWKIQNSKATSAAGDYVAYGGMPGGMEVPIKPMNQTGHSMNGYLDGGFRGSSISQKANYFSDPAGGFFANVARIFASLNMNYGPTAIAAAYRSWTPASAVAQAAKATLEFMRAGGGLLDPHLHGGGMNGDEIFKRAMAKKTEDDSGSGPAQS